MPVELDIVRLGAQGDGVADTPAGPVFVPGALPGERIKAEIDGTRGCLIEILQPAPDRVAPICPHFASCGGCAAQHMGTALYRDWKRSMVTESFRHRGLAPRIDDVVVVGPHSRRRTVLTVRRAGGNVVLGYSAEGSHELIAIERCPVLVRPIESALPRLRELAGLALAAAKEARITVLAAEAGLDVDIEGPAPIREAERRQSMAALAAKARIVRLVVGREPIVLGPAPALDLGGARVAMPPAGFVQASAAAEAAMRDLAVAAVGRARRVADLFCGAGAFTFALARAAQVTAVDSDKALLLELAAAAKRTTGLKPITTLKRDLVREPLSRKELDAFDAVVFDPPRAGAKAQAEALTRSKVPVVVAISCNPATLARDARILVDGGYAIERVVPIDQFAFAAHVEAVTVLRKGKS